MSLLPHPVTKASHVGNPPVVQWLGLLRTSTAGGMGLIPVLGAKILHVARGTAKKKKKKGKSCGWLRFKGMSSHGCQALPIVRGPITWTSPRCG